MAKTSLPAHGKCMTQSTWMIVTSSWLSRAKDTCPGTDLKSESERQRNGFVFADEHVYLHIY